MFFVSEVTFDFLYFGYIYTERRIESIIVIKIKIVLWILKSTSSQPHLSVCDWAQLPGKIIMIIKKAAAWRQNSLGNHPLAHTHRWKEVVVRETVITTPNGLLLRVVVVVDQSCRVAENILKDPQNG